MGVAAHLINAFYLSDELLKSPVIWRLFLCCLFILNVINCVTPQAADASKDNTAQNA